jgi:hypothetical protein
MAATDAMETTQSHNSAVTRNAKAVIYPVGDGKPLGEDESHVRETLNCIQSLQFWFRNRRFHNPAAGQYIPTLSELASQTEPERERATGLETENARLRAELESMRRAGRTRE